MAAPRRPVIGMVNVTSTSQLQGNISVFGYGQHEKAISPGDLVIIMEDYVGQGLHRQKVELSLKLRGRDMHLFVEEATHALGLWEENREWLEAPMTKIVKVEPEQSRLPMAALTHWQREAKRAI